MNGYSNEVLLNYLKFVCYVLNQYFCTPKDDIMDVTAFEKFFKENYTKAYFLALRLLHDEEASKDVVSDAFELVWNHNKNGKVKDVVPYLFHTVRNVSLDVLRKQAVRSRYTALARKMEETYETDTDNREQSIADIMAAISELTPRTQQIIKACYVERKKYREVAAELNISQSAVKKHVMQALKYLRQKFPKNH